MKTPGYGGQFPLTLPVKVLDEGLVGPGVLLSHLGLGGGPGALGRRHADDGIWGGTC